jgi:hypothetical protein
MKIRDFAISQALLAATCFGQGVITFYNDGLIGADGEPYRAGIFRDSQPGDPSQQGGGTIGAGEGYTADLFLMSDLTHPLATTTFRTTTGTEVFAEAKDVIVPGVPPGATANLMVRVWPTESGSFQNALIQGRQWGERAFTTRPLGGPITGYPPIRPPDLGPSFTGFEMQTPVGAIPGWTLQPLAAAALSSIGTPSTVGEPATFAPAQAGQTAPVTLSVTIKPGANLICAPLITTDNSIGALFKNFEGGVPWGTKVFRLVNGQFVTAVWSVLDNKFIPQTVASQTLLPGEGVLLFLPGKIDKTLTFSGHRQEGQICTEIPQGFSLKSNMLPLDLNIAEAGITFLSDGDAVYILDTAVERYDKFEYNDLDERWEPEPPIIPAGQAFFWYSAAYTRTWCRQVLSSSRINGDELSLNWALPGFAVESSTDLRTWTELLAPGSTNTAVRVSSGNAFFRLRGQ